MFESVKQMSDAVKPAATLLSDRVSVTHADARHRRSRRQARLDRRLWRGCRAPRYRAMDHPVAGSGRGHPSALPFTTCTWRWGAATWATSRCRPSTFVRWPTTLRGPSSARRRNSTPARSSSRLPGRKSATPSSARTSTPRGRARSGLAGALRRPGLHSRRSRPDQCQEVQQPGARKGTRNAAGADQRRNRGRLLQHRHRHVDARRPRQADAGRTAGSERHAGGRLRRVHPKNRASRRDGVSRRRDRRRSAGRTRTSTNCTRT